MLRSIPWLRATRSLPNIKELSFERAGVDRKAQIDSYQELPITLQHGKGSIVLEACWFKGFYVNFSRDGPRLHPRAVIEAFDAGPSHPVTCIRAAI